MNKGVDEIIHELLGYHGTLWNTNVEGHTALCEAIIRNNMEYVQILLQAGATRRDAIENAIIWENLNCISFLCKSPKKRTSYCRWTRFCVECNRPKALKALLKIVGNKNGRDSLGFTHLDIALCSEKLACAAILLDAKAWYNKSAALPIGASLLLESRKNIKALLVVIVGLGKRRHTRLVKDTALIIAMQIWETRDFEDWTLE